MSKLNKLNIFALTLLITSAIDSIRNLPATAMFASSLVFFLLFSAIIFLIPTALVSAELAANINEGGIYQWARLAFGERAGFLAVWLQWVNNLIWFPTMLSFIAGTAAYLIDPALVHNKVYLIGVILSTFWLLTILNLKGIRLSSQFTSICTIIGLLIPMATIISLLVAWFIMGKPLQMHLTAANIFPSWQHPENWIALTAIMMGFAGMELATVHIKDVHNPQKTFPRALSISTFIILVTMILGSLAIAFVLPGNQINLVNGTMETFSYYLSAFHLTWLTPILTIFLVLGSLGGIISWMISPIKGLAQAAQFGYLPPIFKKLNQHDVPQNLLILQGVVVSFVCIAFLLFPSVNASYWLLSDLSTQLYMFMYVLMFICAIRLRTKFRYHQNNTETFVIPGKKFGHGLVCLLGLLGCLITICVGFIPPSQIDIVSPFYYEILFCSGMVIMVLPILFFYQYQRKNNFNKESDVLLKPEDVLLGQESRS